jgi:hypothetical protein
MLGEHVLTVRPRCVAVREVICPHKAFVVHLVGHAECDPIVLKREIHVLPEVFTRHLREVPGREPIAMAVVRVISAVHPMRHPARVGLHAHDPEPRMTLEHCAEDQHADDVLVRAQDRHERVEARAAHVAEWVAGLAARENVERRREPEVYDRVPELVVHRVVVIGGGRQTGQHDAAQAERLDRFEVGDALGGRAQRGLTHADQPLR